MLQQLTNSGVGLSGLSGTKHGLIGDELFVGANVGAGVLWFSRPPCYQTVEETSGKFAPSLKDNLSSRLKLLPLRDSAFLAPNSYFTTRIGLRLSQVTEYPPQFNLRLAGLEPKSRRS